jgi:hypothetical protein
LSWLDSIGSALKSIQRPIDTLCDMVSEPLEARRYERNEKAKDSDTRREKERQSSRIKADSDARIREKEFDARIAIQREIDIKRSIAEIDEWKKDKDFQRLKQTAEAVAAYQERLTKLNVSAINAIGHMQLELREKAQKLVYDKTVQYKELQKLAMDEAMDDLVRIENQFSENERAKELLTNAVDKKLSNIIDTANSFLLELSEDIKTLNKSINLLAEQSQISIENHLNRFNLLPNENFISPREYEKLKDAEPKE